MKKFVSVFLAMTMAASLAACGLEGGGAPAASKPAEGGEAKVETEANTDDPYANVEHKIIRFSSTDTTANWNDPGFSNAASDIYMRDLIYERTEGRYKLEVYPDGQLASADTEALSGLRSGDFEMTTLSNGAFGAFSDAYAELSVPFFFPSTEVAQAVMDGSVGEAMAAKGEADLGVKIMFVKDMGFRQVTTKGKALHCAADFKGLKIRTQQDPVQMAAFEALGCAVASIPFSELYTSLQQKVIDSQENPWQNIYYKQLFEVQDNAMVTNHIQTALIYIMNQDFWNSLTPEDQEIFEGIFADVVKYQREVKVEGEKFYTEECTKAGMTIYEPTQEELDEIKQIMVDAVYDQCVEIMGQERWDALNAAVEAASK